MGDPAPSKKAHAHKANSYHAIIDPSSGMGKDSVSTELQYDLLSQQTRDGGYPLHIAIQAGAPCSVLELLIQRAPEVLLKTDKFGRTPLHLALTKGFHVPMDEVELLLSSDTSAVDVRDDHGYLPVDYAVQYGCGDDVARRLAECSAGGLGAINPEGFTPMA
jgi:ankyrin repeat protein